MPVTVKTYGSKVLKELLDGFESGVNDSAKDVYVAAQNLIEVDTGKSKREMKVIPAKKDGDEMFSMVVVPVEYAIYSELRSKAMRRALASAGKSSLRNFENKI